MHPIWSAKYWINFFRSKKDAKITIHDKPWQEDELATFASKFDWVKKNYDFDV